jgi:hypothetical protein
MEKDGIRVNKLPLLTLSKLVNQSQSTRYLDSEYTTRDDNDE